MRITCFGPRGSIPAPSFYEDGVLYSTAKYGGNTSCYYVEAGPFRVILDCGSGVRQLGKHLMKTGVAFGNHFICKISHYHWDHLQGLPFCVPMFIGSNVFHFHGFIPDGHEMGPRPVVEDQLYHQQSTRSSSSEISGSHTRPVGITGVHPRATPLSTLLIQLNCCTVWVTGLCSAVVQMMKDQIGRPPLGRWNACHVDIQRPASMSQSVGRN